MASFVMNRRAIRVAVVVMAENDYSRYLFVRHPWCRWRKELFWKVGFEVHFGDRFGCRTVICCSVVRE
jgi:hypothetical protein